MKTLTFTTTINAPREKVWEVITNKASYEQWTQVFQPTSTFEGEWKTGSKMAFIGTDENGNKGGMVAEIAEVRHPEFISIRHVGMIENGVEDTTSEAVKAWTPAYENYTLTEVDGGTEFLVEMDVDEKYEAMFHELWPKALEKVKAISETE